MLIEDDQDDQDIFLMCLSQVSPAIECKVFSNSSDALAALKSDDSWTPKFVFIEVFLPIVNGIECLGNLRRIERLIPSKIYMYSTTFDSATSAKAESLGGTGFIIKPSHVGELTEALLDVFK